MLTVKYQDAINVTADYRGSVAIAAWMTRPCYVQAAVIVHILPE